MAKRRTAVPKLTDPELEQFLVHGVQFTGNKLGTGAYGTVEEVEIPGARVAAKQLHQQLISLGSPKQVCKWVSDFVEECKLMSQLRHPHIVQFLGVCYFPGSPIPVLLMERLQTSLDNLLETSLNIPLNVKVHLLKGISQGVVYLHSRTPPIAHRDLTARNILIDTGLTAKIGDLGVARMVTIRPGQLAVKMTQAPGNNLYMPPEAVQTHGVAHYNTAIDIFSFGVVSLYTLTQTFPKDLRPATYPDPITKQILGRNEIERREGYIGPMKTALGVHHPLVVLTLNCLEYFAVNRPSAVDVSKRLESFGRIIPQQCSQSKLELLNKIVSYQKKTESSHAKIEQLQAEKQEQVCGLEELITLQQQQLEVQLKEIEQLSSQLQLLETQLRERKVQQPQNKKKPLPAPRRKFSQSKMIPHTVTFTWRRCKDIPQRTKHVLGQPVAIKEKLYVCCITNWQVLEYTPSQDHWTTLPPQSISDFTIAAMKGQLLVVGGKETATRVITNKIYTFDESSEEWIKTCPDMPRTVINPAVLGYQEYLIVAGGLNVCNRESIPNVNILDTVNKRWMTVESLPCTDSWFTALVEDSLYLIGRDTKSVLRTNVLSLLLGERFGVWESLPSAPYSYSPPVTIGDSLLTVGGRDDSRDGVPVADIHLYNSITSEWKKVGELPEPVDYVSCVISDFELFVLGSLFHHSVHAAKLTLLY